MQIIETIDNIEVGAAGDIRIRTVKRVVSDNGQDVVPASYARRVIARGDDLTGEPARVQAIAAAAWAHDTPAA